MRTAKKLERLYNSLPIKEINDYDRYVFVSDCHRGDSSWLDDFAHNQALAFYAMKYYYKEGYHYVEVGDCDELWKNRKFEYIRVEYSNIFWMLKMFHQSKRLHMIYGNHDIIKRKKGFVEKHLYFHKDRGTGRVLPLLKDIEVVEGIRFRHTPSDTNFLVAHGHQGAIINDYLWPLSRAMVRFVWKPLQFTGVKNPSSPAKNHYARIKVENNLIKWIKNYNRMLICGHTHRASFPGEGEESYFNTGSFVRLRYITCIEIVNGDIMLVRWRVNTDESGYMHVDRQIIGGPEPLSKFGDKMRNNKAGESNEASSSQE